MSAESTIEREHDGARAVYRIRGAFDRAGAWALRDRLEGEAAAEILIDFSLVRDFSDLAVAVLAYGLATGARRVSFRGLRQHQFRILRYCGIPVDERATAAPLDLPAGTAQARPSSEIQ
jgi:anti-anti-sigma regulatory factor